MALNINGTTGISGVDGSASAPAVTGTDSNTGINFASDTVNINTGGVTRATVNSSGKLIVGSTDDYAENVQAAFYGASNGGIALASGTSGLSRLMFADATSGNAGAYVGSIIYAHSDNSLRFNVNGGTERMRILSNGDFEFDGVGTATPGNGNNTTGMGFEPRNGSIFLSRGDGACLRTNTNTTDVDIVQFAREGTLRGRVFMQTTTVSYATSSDYRLKENQVLISDGITRLKTLKPYRFNFIEEPSKTVDGFFAHEVTAVPEAVSGTKDAVDSDGNIEPQGLDYGRITPLLTAALQEAIAKIEVLETKVAALEAG